MAQQHHFDTCKAYWFTSQTVLCKLPTEAKDGDARLYYVENGGATLQNLQQHPFITLQARESNTIAVPRYLQNHMQFNVDVTNEKIRQLVQKQLIFAIVQKEQCLFATGVQLWSLFDHTFRYEDSLGVQFTNDKPILRLWAPSAKSVKLHLFDTVKNTKPQILHMQYQHHGMWQIHGEKNWKNKFYLYEVEVFVPKTNRVEKNLVTDPYSLSLAQDSTHSHIIDLDDVDLKPEGWDQLQKPLLKDFMDISLYELHVRDFSILDSSVRPEFRGTFMAFTDTDSFAMQHLQKLSQYGLTHVHLLPVFDIATIHEDRQQQKTCEIPENLARDSKIPQELIGKIRDEDGFNWGYDPFHYAVPEGSYAVNPQGSARIKEMRSMVTSLAKIGLRVVMDVVYNHTHSSGQHQRSVLDKIVPGYYYRLQQNGYVQNTTCCPDTATEHAMMEKLMIDTLVIWAKYYKIDGFRFDLMGHHTVDNLHNIRRALDQLTPEKDGVDGKKIYLYGEGWTFGSLHNIYPQKVMNQINARGTGIGTFNDRLRDTARGGNFEHRTKSDQGFVTGLFYDYNNCADNSETSGNLQHQRQKLVNYANNIRVSLAGGLADFPLYQDNDKTVYGFEIDYRGAPCGYTSQPYECINYISAHDNYTLWDQICAKAPFHNNNRTPNTATTTERIAMQNLGLSLVLLGQGIPFIHAGSEIARSKSGDGDSYNSGDWFNKLDLSYATNNWGVGIPCKEKNYHEWDFWRPRLQDENLQTTTPHILECFAQFLRVLKVRYSSKLFRLPNAKEIKRRVKFLNANAQNLPGVIVMLIDNSDFVFDKQYKNIVMAFNAAPQQVEFSHALLQGQWKLHPALTEPVFISVRGKKHRIDSNLREVAHHQKLILPPRSCTVYLQER
ncbi:pullulanase-type alpha-1,6-glucosidase [Candidatus Uabimicrobium amorphum]|uniref:Alpha-1,6-glucosidase n=1 Tax=Uabimicrobium amorphum TaxID=2596890 RepID=A0A5S9F7S5_UABAM|nr:pullulanase-type alpha-1,6-glucosidase [Candidatus Uabimicrobium amorphum]BBM87964.1 alpha-1,6-glucosidase [Candidatus Uabimicrobium amorphum]